MVNSFILSGNLTPFSSSKQLIALYFISFINPNSYFDLHSMQLILKTKKLIYNICFWAVKCLSSSFKESNLSPQIKHNPKKLFVSVSFGNEFTISLKMD